MPEQEVNISDSFDVNPDWLHKQYWDLNFNIADCSNDEWYEATVQFLLDAKDCGDMNIVFVPEHEFVY